MKQKKFRDVRRRKELWNKYGWLCLTILFSIIAVCVVYFSLSALIEHNKKQAVQEYKQQQGTEADPLIINTEQSHYGFITIYTEQGTEQYYGYIKHNTTEDIQDIKLYTYILPGGMSNDGRCEE